ncbi:hypothetical protein IFM89_007872 [Coptis chinensis]|uniref:Protein kinase domain-containing protein n=1 Tax=Coptis chinensis TaxID=261450 RepID=A0A835LAI1_9MAGN|nr:hypothetical protein IFM89_007862 [Coptis chinensis]KAF9588183.1 hypothetical protein IFM89_007872 [Coptis chinensis]
MEELEWTRGKKLGSGGFASVYMATTNPNQTSFMPPVMAVKSVVLTKARSLERESDIYYHLQGSCPYILGFFGDDVTIENGKAYFNVFLEYGPFGSLGDRIRQQYGNYRIGLHEFEVNRYSKGILEGIKYVHQKNYVHCDIKPDNILLVPTPSDSARVNVVPKIADFGLAKRVGKKVENKNEDGRISIRGTPIYMAPESIRYNEYEPPSDIWAFGLVVLEMLTGQKPWNSDCHTPVNSLLQRIGYSDELPSIPSYLSSEAQDFLKKCLVKDVALRWSVDKLLSHPFVTRCW